MVLAFGPFELDVAACELRCDGKSVALQPRVFATLRYLVERRDRLVSKQELIDALWNGQPGSSEGVPWSISHARKALGQRGRQPLFIDTIRGRGYRFVAEVRVLLQKSDAPGAAKGAAENAASVRLADDEPFVGRADAMVQLEAALDAASNGHGSLCLLTGEPGIGKTRCASELALLAQRRGAQVWSGRCLDGGVAPGFWPFIQVLREACADASISDGERAELESLLAALVPQGEHDSSRTLDLGPAHDDARFWLLDRLTRSLVGSARGGLRVIVLDDLHWADESSLQALSLLLPLLACSHMLVLAAARETARSDLERAAVASLTRFAPCTRVALAGLRVQDVESYMAPVLGALLAAELSGTMHARTSGNPLFLREGARQVYAQHRREGTVRADDVKLPEAARGFFDERLRALPPEARSLLDAACVIGDEIDVALLQRTTALPTEQVLSALQAAVELRIVEAGPHGLKYGFLHPLVREVLYAGLSAGDRARLHAQVGLALEQLALVEPQPNQLAYHFHRAASVEHYERVVRYGRAAGSAAMRVFAYDQAVQFYAWALDAQPYVAPTDTKGACDLLLASAAALLSAGRRRESRAQCKRVVELAQRDGLAEPLIRAARLLRPSVAIAQVPDALAVAALEEALALLPDTSLAARAQAYSQLACLPPYTSSIETARKTCDEAMRLAQLAGDPVLLVDAMMPRLRAISGPDSTAELLQLAEEILRRDSRPSSGRIADVQIARYHTLLRLGDMPAAESALHSFGRVVHRLRAREWIWHYDRLLALRLMQSGKLDAAERRFNELWDTGQRLRLPYAGMYYGAQLNALSLERTGRRLPAGLNTAGPDAWKWARMIPTWRAERVLYAVETGDVAGATREFHALAENDFAAVTRDSACLFAFAKLSKAAVALGAREIAGELYALLLPYEERVAVGDLTFSMGSIAHSLGQLARLLERRDRAREHFEHAIEISVRIDDQLQRPRAELSLALLLADGATRDDRSRARTLAADAADTAQRTGLQQLRGSACALLERLGRNGARVVATDGSRSKRVNKPQPE